LPSASPATKLVGTAPLGLTTSRRFLRSRRSRLRQSRVTLEASLHFYVNRLGFTCPWRYDEDGRAHVAQVDRQGCALILADRWPEKTGKGLIFISLNVEPETRDAATTALDAFRAVTVKDGSWGYRLLVVDDPEGNQLFFNYPS
jgi:catechol 2,3-dioxygenase-like lactoylglutathione lyase family enzyme